MSSSLVHPVLTFPKDQEPVELIDPSELYRPENKKENDFRVYTSNDDDRIQKRVRKLYHDQHNFQTVDFVLEMKASWIKFNKFEMSIMDALAKLNCLVDESDPDVDVPNSVHAFQTAERIRQKYPDNEWFQLTGLVHDLGKVLVLFGVPQFAVTGDTYPVGCAPSNKIVYYETSFEENPDRNHPVYSKKFGMYEPGCGLDKLHMVWSHDEYMYQVLKNHPTCMIPDEGLYCIRFHSFYPWHESGAYKYFMNDTDRSMFKWIKEFNAFDLYSKSDGEPDMKVLIPYYQRLVDKYIPGLVKW